MYVCFETDVPRVDSQRRRGPDIGAHQVQQQSHVVCGVGASHGQRAGHHAGQGGTQRQLYRHQLQSQY